MRVIVAVIDKKQTSGVLMPLNSIVLYGGQESTIPDGWRTLGTKLGISNNFFIRGAAEGQRYASIVGALNHTHGDATTGSAGAHTHFVTGGLTGSSGAVWSTPTGTYSSGGLSHTHSYSIYTSSAGGHSHSVSSDISYNLPPFIRYYWIVSEIDNAPLPADTVLFYNSTSIPEGWLLCNGQSITQNLNSLFIYGAGSDGDLLATGGVINHAHTVTVNPAGGHSHTLSGITGGPSSTVSALGYGGTYSSSGSHNHSITGSIATLDNHTHDIGSTDEASLLPNYVTLAPMMVFGATEIPVGTIVAFFGLFDNIPSGWALCDGSSGTVNTVNKYIRCSTTSVGATGGASSHSHAIGNTDSESGHTHGNTISVGGGSSSSQSSYSDRNTAASTGHTHNSTTAMTVGGSHNHSVGNTGTTTNELKRLNMYFIQKIS